MANHFDPDRLMLQLSEASILAQQQTRWAVIGNRLERLLSRSRQLIFSVDSDGKVSVQITGAARSLPESIEGNSVEETLAIAVGDDVHRLCKGCGALLPIEMFPREDGSRGKHCIDCRRAKAEKLVAKKKLMGA